MANPAGRIPCSVLIALQDSTYICIENRDGERSQVHIPKGTAVIFSRYVVFANFMGILSCIYCIHT